MHAVSVRMRQAGLSMTLRGPAASSGCCAPTDAIRSFYLSPAYGGCLQVKVWDVRPPCSSYDDNYHTHALQHTEVISDSFMEEAKRVLGAVEVTWLLRGTSSARNMRASVCVCLCGPEASS